MVKFFSILMLMMTLTACQSAGLYLANAANDNEHYTLQRDVAYGDKPWQRLDVYKPIEPVDQSSVIVFYYGGSWVKGSKEDYGFIANRFTQEGYTVIIPDYVKYPTAKYPAFVEDAAKVTQWIDANSNAFKLDREEIHLMGHSAGAHIGAMLIADERFLAEKSLSPDFYRSFIGIAGPYSTTPTAERYKAIFGPEENYPNMQADNFINGDEPPMLLLHGGLDWLVGESNMQKLEQAVTANEGSVQTKNYSGLGHLTIIGSVSDSVPFGASVTNDILTFIKENQDEQRRNES